MLSETAELYNLNMRDMKYKCVMYNRMEILNRERFIALKNCVSDVVQEDRALGDCLMVN